ncbi:unnamed protein product [Kluyveromyces dobzhanskii CBS 2104]|uniref:WGS project CCBQ000000000 data, contig 00102 n=1 Tax=Kluyveromyces dobzhanskii CBS 2104 TaxID=1427455 RepID=A0A0A8L6X1_9SACH|nr:unnamed protein product [Kluyveromyces dobzhanskii CBS 2104]
MASLRFLLPVPFRIPGVRFIHSTARILTQEGSENEVNLLLSKHGKKLKPKQGHFLVLTPHQTGVMRLPKKYKSQQPNFPLSVLDGFDLGRSANRDASVSQVQGVDILSNIQETTTKLMKFKEQEDNEQMAKAIESCKPNSAGISEKRYQQLEKVLDEQFTLQQLRNYCFLKHGVRKSRIPKKELIPTIIAKLWKCSIDYNKSEHDDLIVENEISLETRDIYLLLLTKNGRILQNLARIGATIAVVIDENKLVVRATSQIFKYVEVSISKILENVVSDDFSIEEFIKNHSAVDGVERMAPEEVIALMQTKSCSYVEVTDDSGYKISTIGRKNMNIINSLLLWVLNYNPQISETLVPYNGEEKVEKYPLTDYDWVNWISRKDNWHRLQKPVAIKQELEVKKLDLSEKIDAIWNAFENNKQNCAKPTGFNETKSLSIALGHILENSQQKYLFQSKIPQIIPKVLQLPLWDNEGFMEDEYAIDQHLYLVQMKFVPNLADVSHKVNVPPLEVWFNLDENNQADISSVRCVHTYSENSAYVQTPSLSHDYRVTVTDSVDAFPEDLESSQFHSWLQNEQPSFAKFLQDGSFCFTKMKRPRFPSSFLFEVKLEGFETTQKIRYDHLSHYQHRLLRFKYKEDILVQLSEIEGGSLGGNTSSIDFISTKESVGKEVVKQFINDVLQF